MAFLEDSLPYLLLRNNSNVGCLLSTRVDLLVRQLGEPPLDQIHSKRGFQRLLRLAAAKRLG
jgi:hypothetical protein